MANIIEYDLTADQNKAVELIASTPGITNKKIAEFINRDVTIVRAWLNNPTFSNACFERFTELAGTKLIAVVDAMFREAGEGNVAAARLLLEHYNKLDKTLHVKIESPFDRYMQSKQIEHIDVQDAEIMGNMAEPASNLPPRNPDRTDPGVVLRGDKDKLNGAIKESRSNITRKKKANRAYHLRQRARAVGFDTLRPGRHTEYERAAWLKKLKRLELQHGIKHDN